MLFRSDQSTGEVKVCEMSNVCVGLLTSWALVESGLTKELSCFFLGCRIP